MRQIIIGHIILITLCLGLQNAFGQDNKTFYVDSTGRLFVNPGTPVFIYLSTSPDGKDAVRLRSLQADGEPLIWNGHGMKFLTHLNLYLGRRIRFDLFADGMPPTTSTTFDNRVGVQKGNIFYLSSRTAIELSARDPYSGPDGIFYSVNNSDYIPYQQPIVFDKEGEYTIRFYSIDKVGNKEDEGERTVVVDTTPPETLHTLDGVYYNEVISSQTKIKLTATDKLGVKTTFYSINNSTDTRYATPISLASLPEGEHTLSWYSVDIVGNIEQKKSFTFFIDRTAPMVFEEILGSTYMVGGKEYSSGRSQLRIVAVDNKAGVKEIYYSINNKPYIRYEKPIFLSDITTAVNIRSFAIDNVNNKGVSDATGQQFSMPQVDITGPSIKHSLIGDKLFRNDTLWIGPYTNINLQATDNASGVNRIEYKLNDDEKQKFVDPFTISRAGFQSINVSAWDNVENLNVASFNFAVDATPPITNLTIEGIQYNQILSAHTKLKLLASDALGVKSTFYSFNSDKDLAYTGPITLSKLPDGEHIIYWYSIDVLGNVEQKKSQKFYVDITPPKVYEEIVGDTHSAGGKEYSPGRNHLRITAVDNKAGIKEIYYSINNKPFTRYDKPILLSEVTDATIIRSYATDNVENKGASDASGKLFSMPKVDITGPNISHSFTGGQLLRNDTTWIGPTTKVNILAKDDASGVNRIEFKRNNLEQNLYLESFSVSQHGYHTISVNAWDNVENLNVGTFSFAVDSIPPQTEKSIDGVFHNEVFSAQTRFKLTATDALGVRATFYYINSNKETRYTDYISLAKLPEGEHTLYWYSVDVVGNVEPIKSFTFFVDRTAPMVFEEIMGNTYMVAGKEYSSGRSQLRIVAVDNKAGVKEIYYSINNKPYALYEKPIFLSEITSALVIRSYAIDNVNNKGTSDAEGQQFSMPQVDIAGPNIRYSFTGGQIKLRDTLWIGPETKINLLATDIGAGVSRIEYKLNQALSETYSEPINVTQPGFYVLSCTAWDNVDNLNIASFSFGVDAIAPEVFINFSVEPHRYITEEVESIPVFAPGVQIYIAATDNKTGVDRITTSFDNSNERIYMLPISGFKVNQTYTITVRAFDKLGNVSQKSVKFFVGD